jgi:hypothetical protein
VVEEAFGYKAEVTAPCSLPASIDLEERDILVAVDLIPRRMM